MIFPPQTKRIVGALCAFLAGAGWYGAAAEPETASPSHDQGPQIVLAGALGANDDDYPEYRDHYEVVLYSKGINVWRHIHHEGRPGWARVAYARFPLGAGTPYELKVRIEPVARSRNGPADAGRVVGLSVNDGHVFAFHASNMPDKVYVGITGYASVNRFYDFSVDGESWPADRP